MNNNKNSKAESYNSELLDEMLQLITPEEQFQIDQKMLLAAKIYDAMIAKGWNEIILAQKMGIQPSEIRKLLSGT